VPCSDESLRGILDERKLANEARPLVGININSYGESFIKRGSSDFSEERLLSTLSKTIEWIRKELGAEVWLFATQVMDITITEKLRQRISFGRKPPLFTNRQYSYAELIGLFSKLDLLIGMRTHSLILASSVGVPVIGLVTYPKTLGYLRRVEQASRSIPIAELAFERLKDVISSTWEERATVRQELSRAVEAQRALAWRAADFLSPYLSRSGAPAAQGSS
jgi:polysaccharide pyruvyl transferase WcaK-like protein